MRDRNLIRPLRFLRLVACLLLAFGLVHVALPATSQGIANAEWDQKRVTELAVQLAVTMRDLRGEVRRGTTGDRGRAPHSRNMLLDQLRVLERETRFLAAELEAGQGFAETLPVAQRIDRIVDRAAVNARRMMIPEPVQKRVDEANDLLEKLRSFYRNYETPEESED